MPRVALANREMVAHKKKAKWLLPHFHLLLLDSDKIVCVRVYRENPFFIIFIAI